MSSIQICNDTTEITDLCEARGLYLKPLAKLNVCVQLPTLKNPGKSISNWEVMEKLKKMIRPDEFTAIKVSKTSLEFIRFEGEVKNRNILRQVISRIDGNTIKLTGFADPLKVKSAEAKLAFPGRHDWDSFFRDAKNMNEMRPGERPDTIYFENLPTKWFADSICEKDKPSDYLLKQVFCTFGPIRRVDIPMLDTFRKDMNKSVGGIQTFSFNQDLTFEAYVQYKEYVGFVKAMDALRGMKMLFKSADGKAHVTGIKVSFDKTKHLSEHNIRRRELERQKLESLVKVKEEQFQKEKVEEKLREQALQTKLKREQEEEELEKKREARQKIKEKRLKKEKLLKKKGHQEDLQKQALLLKQRGVQARALLKRVFLMAHEEEMRKQALAIERERRKQLELEEKQRQIDFEKKKEVEETKKAWLHKQEQNLREKLLLSLKAREEKRTEEIRERLRKELSGRKVLKSVLVSSNVTRPIVPSYYRNTLDHRSSLHKHSSTKPYFQRR